jgi:tryptophanyl-tRNA synthetase
VAKYETLYKEGALRFSDMKDEISARIFEELKPLQEKRKTLEENPDYVDKVIREGAQKARDIARKTVAEVKGKMGLA